MYAKYFKRVLDFLLSLCALIVLAPVFTILIVLGAIFMRGNPFFTQERPGKNERIFRLIKFRTMDNRKDKDGRLLPDEVRLNKYGRVLRSISLDELPELINILIGDMSIIGPRPLLVSYLPRYNEEQKHRHDVRSGLTGYAQAHGRNALSWEDKFAMDMSLEFVHADKRTAAYAASTGKITLSETQQQKLLRALEHTQHISIREKDSIPALQALTDKEIVSVLDPTMLLTAKEWDRICSKRLISEPYLFCYFLGGNENLRKISRAYADSRGLKLVTLPYLNAAYRKVDDKGYF